MSISSSKIKMLLMLFAVAIFWSCEKQIVNEYGINAVHVSSQNSDKKNLKSDLQLITIMHADVFGTAITNEKLKALNQAYVSFGDKDIVIDRITQHFLTDSKADIPTTSYMRLNLTQFITAAYVRFYVRQPSEAEMWYLKKIITDDLSITARDVYYALLTAEEYKYY